MAQHEPASAAELEIRYAVIRDYIVQGLSQADIVRECLDKHPDWNIGDRQIRNYYSAEWQAMSEEALGVDRKAYYLLTVKQLDNQIGKALKADDIKNVNALLQTRIKLMKLDTPQAIDWQQYVTERGYTPNEVVSALVSEFEQDNHAHS